jgi:hypothetical protein
MGSYLAIHVVVLDVVAILVVVLVVVLDVVLEMDNVGIFVVVNSSSRM